MTLNRCPLSSYSPDPVTIPAPFLPTCDVGLAPGCDCPCVCCCFPLLFYFSMLFLRCCFSALFGDMLKCLSGFCLCCCCYFLCSTSPTSSCLMTRLTRSHHCVAYTSELLQAIVARVLPHTRRNAIEMKILPSSRCVSRLGYPFIIR